MDEGVQNFPSSLHLSGHPSSIFRVEAPLILAQELCVLMLIRTHGAEYVGLSRQQPITITTLPSLKRWITTSLETITSIIEVPRDKPFQFRLGQMSPSRPVIIQMSF